ncbi:hypothetical protein JSY17_14925 [Pseudomonas capsici]|uniref:hypothetical protein n=1 Tax=Pseudomonas capsici TaxID=2810614 RepID=UPI0019D0A167|nr:hypothetical protein [Pseudomonas capsici]MBN6715284.1 hypothetical protein [Pseudomonas capsici]MBN6720319.1 hypothetical protein [Pseudomonas capsici]MBN6725185.1 hypothetical protein [Pseudomonas capsici]
MANLWEPVNGIYTATAPLLPWVANLFSIDTIKGGGALISAGFGAGIGAWMAGHIAKSTKLRDELLTELRSIDVALTLCASIIDVAGALKKQHVLGLLSKYESDLARFALYKAAENQAEPFSLSIDNLRFQTITPPIVELQGLILKNMSVSPNAVKSMIALADAIGNLNGMIDAYNELLEMFRNGGLPAGFAPKHYYLGLPVGGVINNEYGSAVRGIAIYTDDVIFFVCKLADCISSQAVKVRDRYEKLSGEKRLTRRIDPLEENTSLIPPDSAYEGWMRGWEEDFSVAAKKRWWYSKQK